MGADVKLLNFETKARNVTTKPLFTIIIAIRNAGLPLSKTLDSLERQTFRDFEVVVADGRSSDNPSQYMNTRSLSIQHVVQDDISIYDAWNKVLPICLGEWIYFMGAGDVLETDETLCHVSEYLGNLPEAVLIAYGQVDVLGENGQILHRCGFPWIELRNQLEKFGMIPHQAVFQRRASFQKYGPFDTKYLLIGDTDMFLRLASVREPEFFEMKVANFVGGGMTSKPRNRFLATKELHLILKKHGIDHPILVPLIKAIILSISSYLISDYLLKLMIDFFRRVTKRPARYF